MKLFHDLTFLLVPGATSRVATLKMKAWAGQGARIVHTLSSEVTHVLVAPRVRPTELSNEFESGEWLVVKDEWASDSIAQKRLLNVSSYLVHLSQVPLSRPSVSRAGEPQRKKAKALETAPSGSAPVIADSFSKSELRTEESASSELGALAPPVTTGKTSCLLPDDALTRDALDEGVNPNHEVIHIFNELARERSADGKEFSRRAYQRAALALEKVGTPLKTAEQAKQLVPDLGDKMAKMIEDIVQDRIPEQLRSRREERSRTLLLFQTVYGVGSRRASEFYQKGYRTLADILAASASNSSIDRNMQVSIVHHEDLVERISRYEVERHYRALKKVLSQLDTTAQAFCMGSFRRGSPDCGDVDIVLTKEGADRRDITDLSRKLVEALYRSGQAQHTFSDGHTKWIGISKVDNGKWRQMDILAVPHDEIAGAMIYFTGNNDFNRALRLRAKKLGMSLNERGLFKDDVKLEGADEKRIFELLNVEWREATNRRRETFALTLTA